jgi:hypothetical protein
LTASALVNAKETSCKEASENTGSEDQGSTTKPLDDTMKDDLIQKFAEGLSTPGVGHEAGCPKNYVSNGKTRCLKFGESKLPFDAAKLNCENEEDLSRSPPLRKGDSTLFQFVEDEDFLILNYAFSRNSGPGKYLTPVSLYNN